jgi:hypothetical protein
VPSRLHTACFKLWGHPISVVCGAETFNTIVRRRFFRVPAVARVTGNLRCHGRVCQCQVVQLAGSYDRGFRVDPYQWRTLAVWLGTSDSVGLILNSTVPPLNSDAAAAAAVTARPP